MNLPVLCALCALRVESFTRTAKRLSTERSQRTRGINDRQWIMASRYWLRLPGVNGVEVGILSSSLLEERDEGGGRAGQRAVAAINEAQFAPEVYVGDGNQLHFAGPDFVARKTRADQRHTQARRDEALDHAHARQFHGDLQLRFVRPKVLIQQLPRISRSGKNQWLLG